MAFNTGSNIIIYDCNTGKAIRSFDAKPNHLYKDLVVKDLPKTSRTHLVIVQCLHQMVLTLSIMTLTDPLAIGQFITKVKIE